MKITIQTYKHLDPTRTYPDGVINSVTLRLLRVKLWRSIKMELKNITAFQWIKIGFLLGIGISIPLTIATYIPMIFFDDYVMSVSDEYLEEGFKEFGSESKLEVLINNVKEVENGIEFIGVLENQGEDEWDSATIEIELFDSKGNFLDEVEKYIQGTITPNSKHNFKVGFYNCDKEKKIEFADFKSKVISAY